MEGKRAFSFFLVPLFRLFQLIIGCIEKPVLRGADLAVVVSDLIKEKLERTKLVDEEKILVLPNGVNPDKFFFNIKGRVEIRNKLGLDDGMVLVGFAGTFGNWHGVKELTDAIKILQKNFNIFFLMIGDGLMKGQMEEQLKDYCNVFFVGSVPHKEMPSYLSACDILMISNSWDKNMGEKFFGSPTKLFEYMSVGRAIVASDLEQIGDILTDNENAALFTPGDVNGIVERITELSNDEEKRKNLGLNARKLVEERYTWRGNAEKILEFIDENI